MHERSEAGASVARRRLDRAPAQVIAEIAAGIARCPRVNTGAIGRAQQFCDVRAEHHGVGTAGDRALAHARVVGIGQSETAVCDMTDSFLALMLPGAGDELQGIKKGLVELADLVAINKADGDNIERANLAAAEYRGALHILSSRSEHWQPPVLTYSALTGAGIDALWQKIREHRTAMNASGEFAARRRQQQVKWMWSMLEQRMMARLRADPSVRSKVKKVEAEVADGRVTPALAAEQIAGMLR